MSNSKITIKPEFPLDPGFYLDPGSGDWLRTADGARQGRRPDGRGSRRNGRLLRRRRQ